MSQASDVEALLLRFLESEGSRTALCEPKHLDSAPPLVECADTHDNAAATPHHSQRSIRASLTEEEEEGETERGGASCLTAKLPVGSQTSKVHSYSSASSDTQQEAATPIDQRPDTRLVQQGRMSSESASSCPSCASSSEAGRVNRQEDEEARPRLLTSSPSPSSSPPVLSLSHPVVEFLASVQMQGYAAHIIEDLHLRTMAALITSVASEADVARHLGPYASLQQQSDFWRGLKRWEREEVRRARAEAEDRRRRQIAEAREQRLQEKSAAQKNGRSTAKEGKGRKAARRGSTNGSGDGQPLPMTLLTQLQQDSCFSLPSIFDRAPTEVTVPSHSSVVASTASYTVSSETLSNFREVPREAGSVAEARENNQQQQGGISYGSSMSFVSLTTSATQLMRELSYRRTRSGPTQRGPRPRSGDVRGQSQPHDGVFAEGQNSATQLVPFDVDAEEVDVEGEEGDVEQVARDHQYGAAQAESEKEEEARRGAPSPPATPSPSRQSSESHLSSLLCSLQGVHNSDPRENAPYSPHGGSPHNAIDLRESTMEEASEGPSTLLWQQKGISTNSFTSEADGARIVLHNALVASRHVSLGALSAHAELEHAPPPLPPSSTTQETENVDKGPVNSVASELPGDDNDGARGSSSVVSTDVAEAKDDSDVVVTDDATAPNVQASNRLAEARARLEVTLRAALQLYNDEVAAAAAEERPEEVHHGPRFAEQERPLEDGPAFLGPVCAVLHPWPEGLAPTHLQQVVTGSSESVAQNSSLVRWASPCRPRSSERTAFECLTSSYCEDEKRKTYGSATSAPTHESPATSSTQQPPLSVSASSAVAALPRFTLLPSLTHPACPSSLPLPPSGRGTTATIASSETTNDVVLSALSSADVSARTTARPTALPFGTASPWEAEDASADLVGADELACACGPCMKDDRLLREGGARTSRSESVAELTAGTQPLRLQLSNREEPHPEQLPQSAPSECLSRCFVRVANGVERPPQRCSTATVLGGEEEDEQEEEAKEEDLCQCVPVWVEEAADVATAASKVPTSQNSGLLVRSPERGRRSGSSEGWWDSYGIGALDYTQNNMDEQPAATQNDGLSEDEASRGLRGTSPSARPIGFVEGGTTSPPPVEVVEVTSSEEAVEAMDSEVEHEALSNTSVPAPTVQSVRGTCRPPLSPAPALASHHHHHDTTANSSTFASSCLPLTSIDSCRLEPSVWRRMTNEELRALCLHLGLAVRPTRVPAATPARSLSPSSPACDDIDARFSPSQSSALRTASPEWCSLGLAGTTTAAAAAPTTSTEQTLVSPQTSRALFEDASGLAAPSSSAQQDEATANHNRGEDGKEMAARKRGREGAVARLGDGRTARMEREALLEALQLLAVRLRFRQHVAPFFLHRVPHFSGLPYKRVRAADLLDEATVLTREDLQQARQRYRAEEQAEVERCVLAALVAEAAESVEHYAQHAADTATGEQDEESSSLLAASSSRGSPLRTKAVATAGGAPPSCYDQILLREPVNVEAATAAVQRCFPHVAHTRVQQLLTANEVIADVVVTAPQRSPSPPPPSTPAAPAEAAERAVKKAAESTVAAASSTFSPTQDMASSQTAPVLSQEALRRANTRHYFAQRGYLTRGGMWGRGGRRGGRGGGRR